MDGNDTHMAITLCLQQSINYHFRCDSLYIDTGYNHGQNSHPPCDASWWIILSKYADLSQCPLTIYVKLCVRMRRECRERFARHRLPRKPLVSDPGMHHGTCATHVPWCMSGSLTRGGGKTFPALPVHAQLAILRTCQRPIANEHRYYSTPVCASSASTHCGEKHLIDLHKIRPAWIIQAN